MNEAIQFHSRVDDDGMLNLRVNLGNAEAKREVVVTIEPLRTKGDSENAAAMAWPDFVERTYGSCAGLGLERPEQGAFELREPIE